MWRQKAAKTFSPMETSTSPNFNPFPFKATLKYLKAVQHQAGDCVIKREGHGKHETEQLAEPGKLHSNKPASLHE